MAESGRSARTTALIALAIFVGVTLILTWGWLNGGDVLYGKIFRLVGRPLYDLFGIDDVSVRLRLRYANYVPFLGLIAATPGLTWPQRGRALLIGIPLLFVSHLLLNLTATKANHYQFGSVAKLVADGSPFLLWAVLCRSALAPLGALALGAGKGKDAGTDP